MPGSPCWNRRSTTEFCSGHSVETISWRSVKPVFGNGEKTVKSRRFAARSSAGGLGHSQERERLQIRSIRTGGAPLDHRRPFETASRRIATDSVKAQTEVKLPSTQTRTPDFAPTSEFMDSWRKIQVRLPSFGSEKGSDHFFRWPPGLEAARLPSIIPREMCSPYAR